VLCGAYDHSAVEDSMVKIRAERALVRRFFAHPEIAYVKQALHWCSLSYARKSKGGPGEET
jgi:hypothetical protein